MLCPDPSITSYFACIGSASLIFAPDRKERPSRHSVQKPPFMELPQLSRAPGSPRTGGAPPIGAEIRETHLLFKKLLHQRLRERRVTSAQWAFPRILWNEDGLKQTDLAERVGVHQTTTVPAVTILERNGYVRSTSDRRRMMIHVTDAGRRLALDLIP